MTWATPSAFSIVTSHSIWGEPSTTSLSVIMPRSVSGRLCSTGLRKTTSSFTSRTVGDQAVISWDMMAMFIAPGTIASGSPSLCAFSRLVNRVGPASRPQTCVNSITWSSVTSRTTGPTSSPRSTSSK